MKSAGFNEFRGQFCPVLRPFFAEAVPEGQGGTAMRAASVLDSRRREAERERKEVAEYPDEIGCERLMMRNGVIIQI
jgi:hypothetical protein